MPLVNIVLVKGRTTEQKRKVAQEITNVICEQLKVQPSSVTVVFQEVTREDIATAGVLLADK